MEREGEGGGGARERIHMSDVHKCNSNLVVCQTPLDVSLTVR